MAKFWSISLYNQPFSRLEIGKNWKSTKWQQNGLKHLNVKSPLYAVNSSPPPPKAQICTRVTLWPTAFEIQGGQKSEMHRITSEWHWTLISQKWQVHTKYIPPTPTFLALLDCVSRAHCLGFLPSSAVHRLCHNYLRIYWPDFSQNFTCSLPWAICPDVFLLFFFYFEKKVFSDF